MHKRSSKGDVFMSIGDFFQNVAERRKITFPPPKAVYIKQWNHQNYEKRTRFSGNFPSIEIIYFIKISSQSMLYEIMRSIDTEFQSKTTIDPLPVDYGENSINFSVAASFHGKSTFPMRMALISTEPFDRKCRFTDILLNGVTILPQYLPSSTL